MLILFVYCMFTCVGLHAYLILSIHTHLYVTGQRVLATPLCIRQHYGHPDLFDKFFTMTEGGMSKG